MKKKVSIQQYSYYILYIISYGSKNFFESNKEFLKFDIYSEIAYYIFFVYISKQILLIKYSQQTVDSIVNNIILKNIEIEYY